MKDLKETEFKFIKSLVISYVVGFIGVALMGFSFYPTNLSGVLQNPILYFIGGGVMIISSIFDFTMSCIIYEHDLTEIDDRVIIKYMEMCSK